MGLVLANPTTPQIEGLTKAQLIKALLDESGLGMWGTATSGSATVIGDTAQLKSNQFNSREWVGGWAQILQADAAAPEGEIKPITGYDPTHATDHITVDTFTAAVAAGDEYALWKNPSPERVTQLIDTCLKEDLFLPSWSVLTEVPDGDMEQSTTTDWTPDTATPSKLSAVTVGMVGKYCLRTVADDLVGYVSQTLQVEGGKTYHLSALGQRGTCDSIQLILRDATNSTELDSLSYSGLGIVRLHTTVTIPSTCKQVQIRLQSTHATLTSRTAIWDELCFFSPQSHDIRLPWWVKKPDQVLGIFELEPRTLSTDIWISEFVGEPNPAYYILDNSFGGPGLRAVNRYDTLGNYPLYIYGLRNEEAYANINTEKKYIDRNLFVACVLWKIYRHLASPSRTGGTSREMVIMEQKWEREYQKLTNAQMSSLKRTLRGPDPWVRVFEDVAGQGIRY